MDKNSDKFRPLFICLTLAMITLAVFYQLGSFSFIDIDDAEYVWHNPNIQQGFTLKAITWAFTSGYEANWHPVTWLSHTLDWQLFGTNAGDHHLVNLAFHIANTLLLFLVLKRMTNALWQSAFVAALFALHPLHVESVAWISERKDVLSAFFWLLTMWAYIYYVNRPGIIRYLSVVLFFALGLMSKPMLVTLPFVLLLLDYWPLNRFKPKRSIISLFAEKIPLFVMVIASSVITFIAQKQGGTMRITEDYSFAVRAANAFISYIQYIYKMIWPANLSYFYLHPGPNVSFFYAAISAALLLAVTILAFRYSKNHRYLVTGWLWYLGTLVPVIGFVQVGIQAMADRYSYITLTGLFIIVAWGLPELLAKWHYRKIVLWCSSISVLFILTALTYSQSQYWKDSVTLYQHALNAAPDNWKVNMDLAQTLLRQGRTAESIRRAEESVKLKPDCIDAINVLGVVYYYAGKTDQAIAQFNQALKINPNYKDARKNLSIVLAKKSQTAHDPNK
jgi:protein O-mannosyl-transferase